VTSDLRSRIDAHLRAAGLPQTDATLGRLEQYWALLARWNQRMNLTALPLDGAPEPSLDRLIVEPLDASRFVPAAPMRWFDFGSGGGSPAVPLKIIRPAALLTMVESKGRKAAFLREVVRSLELTGTAVESERFESVAERPALAGRVDLITARAVSLDQALLGSAGALLRSGGHLLNFALADRADSPAIDPQFELVARERLRTASRAVVMIWKRR